MSRTVLVVAALALLACTFVSAQADVAAPRFAEAETEDSAVLASQQAEFEASLDVSQIEDEAEEEDEAVDEDEAEDEEEAEDEAEAEDETEDEADEEAEDEEEDEVDEEAEDEEAADEEAEDEDEEAEEESEEEETEFVLAELSDNAVSTGFMEMTATFKPTESRVAEHLVHSLDSHQLAVAEQEYSVGYAHGHADASSNAEEADEEDSDAEPALVEAEAEADAENPAAVQYIASNGQPYFASYPAHVATVAPYMGAVPMPPQLPSWLPPPPYITPLPAKAGKDE